MAKRATATNWEVITRDDEGAMVNIDFDCPPLWILHWRLYLCRSKWCWLPGRQLGN